jgi:hypothetical protein
MGALAALALVACNGGPRQQASVAPDVSLTYTRDDATRLFVLRYVLHAAAREEVEVPLPDGCGQVAEVALAPGAAKLALVCQSGRWPVYIVDLKRFDYVKVAEPWGGGLRWSPDGLTLAYGLRVAGEERSPGDPVAIHLVSSDGTNDRELLPPRLWQDVGPWAPDGKSILITTCVSVEQLQGHVLITEQHWLNGEREPSVIAEGVTPVDWSLRAGALLGWYDSCPEGSQRPSPWAIELPFGDSYAIGPPTLSPAGWLDSGDKALLYWMRSPETVAGEVWLADRKGSWQFERALAVPEGIDGLELAPDRRSVLYVDGTGGLYVWDVIERGEPRLLARDAPANLSAALDDTAD